MLTLNSQTLVSILAVLPATFAWPTVFPRAQAATDLCGTEDYLILDSTPWIVYNMLYNADEIVGTQCTGYKSTSTSSDTQKLDWTSTTEIKYVESTYVQFCVARVKMEGKLT